MSQNQFSATKNVICFDLTNVSEKSLQTWLELDGSIHEITRLLLFNWAGQNQEQFKSPECVTHVYFQDGYMVATINHGNPYKLDFGFHTEEEIKEIAKLSVDYNDEIRELITKTAKRINNGKPINLSESEVISLQYYQQQYNQQMGLVQLDNFKDVVSLQIVGAMDIEIKKVRSLQAIKPVYSYFKKKPDCPNIILPDLKVQQLFYKGNLLIAYTIKHPQFEDVLFCWDEDYENELSLVEPIKIESLLYKPSLNGVLDKISAYGMSSLTELEMEFLENIK